MNDYPQSIDELDLNAVQLAPEIVDAARRFAASRPWRGTVKRRKAKFRAGIKDICIAAGAKQPRVIFAVDEDVDSGRSCCVPTLGLIVLRGRLSVVTGLHEVMHLLYGPSEKTAVAMSLALFRAAFPRSFRKLTFRGHMAVAPRRV
jgi:hypothetical protein